MATDTTPAPTEALLPCPFCANQPEPSGHYAVICMGCGVSGPAGGNFEEARAAWNRRAQPAASPAPVVAQEPLTGEQADAIAKASFEKHCGRPHPWEGAQPWVIAAIKHAAHGITSKEGGPNAD